MFDNLRQDYSRIREIRGSRSSLFWLECLLFENGFNAVLLYRIAHGFKSRRIPFMGPFFARLSQIITGVEIGPAAMIGPGLFISHGEGVVIGGGVKIGRNAFLLQQVTIGATSQARIDQMPVLGDDVFVGAGARVLGGVRIGSHVKIGANSVVTENVPDHSRVRLAGALVVTISAE